VDSYAGDSLGWAAESNQRTLFRLRGFFNMDLGRGAIIAISTGTVPGVGSSVEEEADMACDVDVANCCNA